MEHIEHCTADGACKEGPLGYEKIENER